MSSAQSSRENKGEAECFLMCLGLHSKHKIIIIILLYLSEAVPVTEGIMHARSTFSSLFREFCVSECTSLMNVCCLEILDPHNYWPGIADGLAAWLGPKWLRDADNSELFFSREIPLAISTS